MHLLKNVTTLIKTPGMIHAYARWCWCRTLNRPGPLLQCANRTRLGLAWVSFSEYWSLRRQLRPAESQLFRNLLHPGNSVKIAFDVGANVGLYTIEMAALGYEVHAFEPVPGTFSRLHDNVTANNLGSRVILNRMALGDKVGTVTMHVEPRSPATNHVVPDDKQAPSTCIAPLTTLDSYMERRGLPSIDVLKLDVEGFELPVLLGARETLKRRAIRVALFEVCPPLLARAGFSPDQLVDFIQNNGYLVRRVSRDGALGETLSRADLNEVLLENLAATPI